MEDRMSNLDAELRALAEAAIQAANPRNHDGLRITVAPSAIISLLDQRQKAEEDTKRLDWMQGCAIKATPVLGTDREAGEMGYRVHSDQTMVFGEGVTLRAAIDAATRHPEGRPNGE